MDVPLESTGTMEVPTGQLWMRSSGNIAGVLDVESGSLLRVEGNYVLAPGTVVTVDGTLQLVSGTGTFNELLGLNGAVSISGGTWNWNADQVFGSLNLSGGVMAGTGTLLMDNVFTWSGGRLSGVGRTIIESNVVAVLSGGSTKNLDAGRVLENRGVVRWSGGNINLNSTGSGGSGRIENVAGAVWEWSRWPVGIGICRPVGLGM
jgi:hypothetical protein